MFPEQKGRNGKQSDFVLIKKEVKIETYILEEDKKPCPINTDYKPDFPKAPDSNCDELINKVGDYHNLENMNLDSTRLLEEKVSEQPIKKSFVLENKINNNLKRIYEMKKSDRKLMRKLSRNHIIESLDLIEHFILVCSLFKKNAQIVYKISTENNNKYLLDNFLLDFFKIKNFNEIGNTFCSREKIIRDFSTKNLLLEKMDPQELCFEFNDFPTLINDDNYDGDDDNKINDDITINANFGPYKEECATVNHCKFHFFINKK